MEWILLVLNIAATLGVVVLLLFARGARAYAGKKGENLATKEDVGAIQREIESVRAEYAERLQKIVHENAVLRDVDQRRHQLSMAAWTNGWRRTRRRIGSGVR